MLRGTLFGRSLGKCLKPGFNFGSGKHHFNLKRMFSAEGGDEEGGELEVIPDEQDDDGSKSRVRPLDYQFYGKNIAIVLENPLFPYNNKVVHLGKYHAKLLNTKMPLFVTCILRKELDEIQETLGDSDKPPSGSMVGRNCTSDFYSLGTYCSVEYNKENPNKINLRGIHKVDVKAVHEYTLAYEEENNLSQFKGLIQDLSQEEAKEEDHSPVKTKEEHKSMETFLRQGLQAIRENSKSKVIDENKLHITEIERVYNQKVQLSINDRVKLEHMVSKILTKIELSKKIMTIQNMPFLQDTPLNFNDIELYLDLYSSFVIKSRFFSRDEILPAFLERSVPDRLQIVHSLMKKYHLLMTNMNEIGKVAQRNMMARQSKAYYNEVFQVLKNLSEGGKRNQKFVEKLTDNMSQKQPPKHVMEIFSEHVKRLLSAGEESSEINTIKAYLDWIVSIPYGVKSDDNLDINSVKEILDSEHYGLDDVKDRILEFVAVGKMRKTVKEKILLLQGPPGVGKTSLAESIAKALGREYDRISLGGESDSSVLKGHRRTYVGAYPGKIVTALKKAGKENCVIILDEVDKLGRSNHHGDPQSNLLEILDPAQNKSFTDNYLDYPIDLSNILFICTANSLNTISEPLLDRMDVITLSSYTNQEKKEIFYRHLLPKAIKDAGLSDAEYFELEKTVVDKLINDYCREPGVRSLERHARKIVDKVAYQVVTHREESPEVELKKVVITTDNLKDYAGNPIFEKEQIYTAAPPGVAIGLAYTQIGGSILFLEAKKSTFTRNTRTPGIKFTGSLGNVMSESMKIAYTFSRNYLNSQGIDFFEKNDIHIHAPEGATPKDGPSAGITIASSLISLATDTPVKPKLGMTGELSLNGKVMKIGGVKEKTLAGKREGLKELIFPKENEDDVNNLKDYIREGITFHFVSTFDEAKKIIFPTGH